MASNIKFIRHATLVLNYAGKSILVDPMLAEKDAYPALPGTANGEVKYPMVGLPVKPESLFDVDAVLVSHLHTDHWDEAAAQLLPKDIRILVPIDSDAKVIKSQGFTNVGVLAEDADFEGLAIRKTYCQHGTDVAYSIPQLAELLGNPAGFYFNAAGEKSIYFLGDTLWIEEVENNLITWKPDVVVVNAGVASLADPLLGPVTMGKEDVEKIHQLLPNATIIAIHMDVMNHCLESRSELKAYVEERGFAEKVIIPQDGEEIVL